jgi:hypothetical protein
MTHKRNTLGLARAAKDRRASAIKRAEAAIRSLIKEKRAVNFNSVSKLANVSKPWLYKEEDIRQQIEEWREKTPLMEQSLSMQKGPQNKTSQKSKNHLIEMLKGRIHKLEGENETLKEQIEVLYGELYKKREAIP